MRTFKVYDSIEQYATNFQLALKGFIENEPCPEATPSVDPEVAALIAESAAKERAASSAPSGSLVATPNSAATVSAPIPEPPRAVAEQNAVKLFGEALKVFGETVEAALGSKKR